VAQRFICPLGHQWELVEAVTNLSILGNDVCPVCGLHAQLDSQAQTSINIQANPINPAIQNSMDDAEAISEIPFVRSEIAEPILHHPPRSRPSRLVLILICGLTLVIVLFCLGLRAQTIHWVGAQDLEITFLVTDAESDQPIKGAKIEVLRDEVNFCEKRETIPFHLDTDANGIAISFEKQCMCFGTEGWSWKGRIDTFGMHVPGWLLRVSAPGYKTTEPFWLHSEESIRNLDRGTDFAKLKVPMKLQKAK